MSFVTADLDLVSAATGQLDGIRSALGQAAASASGPTTGIAAAAQDEVSAAVSQAFGKYGQEFQALSTQASAFHAEFTRLINGSAASYLSAEIANAAASLPAAGLGDILGGLTGGTSTGGTTTGGNSGGLGGLGGILDPITGGGSGGLGGLLGGGGSGLGLPTIPGLPSLSPTALNPVLGAVGGVVNQVGQTITNLGNTLQNLLFPPATSSTSGSAPYPNPYLTLLQHTSDNLNLMGADYKPFPILNQIAINQGHYAQVAANAIAYNLSGFPGNVPANIALQLKLLESTNMSAGVQQFMNGSSGTWGVISTQLSKAGADLQTTYPVFQSDLSKAGAAWNSGDYNASVQYASHSLIDLFITGFDTSHLAVSGAGVTFGGQGILGLFPISIGLGLAGPIGVLGPAGDLLPILTAIGQNTQGTASTFPLGSIASGMAHNFANGVDAMTNSSVSANFTVGVEVPETLVPSAVVAGEAIFGLPLQLGFALMGSPFAAMNGLATGATWVSQSLAAGNLVGALNGLGNTPAFVLDGFLNGEVIIQQPLPVTMSVAGAPVTVPVIANLPLAGLLVHPHGITATVPLNQILDANGGVALPLLPDVTIPLGGSKFGGLIPFLLNTMPQQVAGAMSYTNSE